MKTEPTKPGHGVYKTDADRSVRPSLRLAAWLLGLLCLGLLAAVWFSRRPPEQSAQDTAPAASQGVVLTPSTTPQRAPPASRPATGQPTQPQTLFAEPEPAMRQFVNSLVSLQPVGGLLPEEQAAAWRTNLQQLVEQGATAVPAIREFLLQNTDFDFGPDGQQILGYPAARTAMFDALAQIGGPLAVAALTEVLQTTADPREIALLGQSLDKLEPGLHQQQAVDAARQSLAMATEGNLPGRDVAPLFEVLQKYGGSSAVPDLEQGARQWNYYATIALAQLPDGAGIPSLVQMADGENAGARTAAFQMLAQAALQSPDARAALLDRARQGRISEYDWAALDPLLAGNQMVCRNSVLGSAPSAADPSEVRSVNIPASNQHLSTIPLTPLTADQLNQLKTFADDLLQATSDPKAVKILQGAKNKLNLRSIVASAPGA